ncbi:phosphatidylglycerophosphatase A [Aestuariibius sp. 2305UL40-4]|uniref:phosphatidylglycerophosphatase A family protein n=1 Tax=Aestuariibius violaceus TaxID=3234132 RepID=UPI00345E80EE
MRLPEIIGTVGGVGYLRPASGTWGSLAALPLAALLYLIAGPWAVVVATVAAFAAGYWATQQMIGGPEDDPSEVVIDEVVGQWISLLPILFGAAANGVSVFALWPGWVAAFVLFRLFDIWKPGPVGWGERRHGALGVMLDDVIAGVLAAVGVTVLAALWHGVLA